jgi:hypothetical protein
MTPYSCVHCRAGVEFVGEIGDVVKVITAIAAQTNLLAMLRA